MKLLEPEQLLSPSMLKSANSTLTVCLAVLSGLGLLNAAFNIINFFNWKPITGLIQAAGAIAIPLAVWLIVRLLTEILITQQTLNDRLTLLTEGKQADDADVIVEPAQETPAPVEDTKAEEASEPVTPQTEETEAEDQTDDIEAEVDAAMKKSTKKSD